MRDFPLRYLTKFGLGVTAVLLLSKGPLLAAGVPSREASPDAPEALNSNPTTAEGKRLQTPRLTGVRSKALPVISMIDQRRLLTQAATSSEIDEIDALAPLEDSAESGDDANAPIMETIVDPGELEPSTSAQDTSVESVQAAPSLPQMAPEMSPPAAPTSTRLQEDALPEPLPEYLQPLGNPLLIQTQPEEVEILGVQPVSLENAVELAYRNSPELQIVLLQLERSRAALREARAELWPTLDAIADIQANNSASPVEPSPFTTNRDDTTTVATGRLQLNYDLGLSGGRRARIRAAEETLRNAELEVERVREQLRLDTINFYYNLQNAIEQIRINQTLLEQFERNLRDATLREEVGVGTRFDVLTARVEVANSRQALIQSQSDRNTAQRQLAAQLNLPPSINLTTLAVEIAGSWPLTLEESIVLAYQQRAELEQQLVQREISEQQRRIALSAVRPELSLFANYDIVQGFSTGAAEFDDGFTVGARLQWRLFDGGAAAASAEQRQRDREIAESQFTDIRNSVRVEVEQAFFDLNANQENISTNQLALQEAQEAVELANLRFNAGVGTQLEVLEAVSDLATAEGNLISSILNYNRALASLERAVSNLASDVGG